MSNIRKQSAATVATLALGLSAFGLGVAPGANAAPSTDAPCAKEQGQLDKAQAKLDSLTAKLAEKKAAIAEARAEVKGSDTAKEKRSAKADVAQAKEKKVKVKKAKKFQAKRVEKKQAKLDKCMAAQPTAPTA